MTLSDPDVLEAFVALTNSSCNGGIDGSAELTIEGGTAPYTTEDLSGLSAGIYTTTVIDANGCETSVEFTISEPDELVASVVVTDVSCNGLNDGSAELTIAGGAAPYDTEDLSSLFAGTYTTTVADANGCETSVEFTISEPDADPIYDCFGFCWNDADGDTVCDENEIIGFDLNSDRCNEVVEKYQIKAYTYFSKRWTKVKCYLY